MTSDYDSELIFLSVYQYGLIGDSTSLLRLDGLDKECIQNKWKLLLAFQVLPKNGGLLKVA